jgi:hypothetical protein
MAKSRNSTWVVVAFLGGSTLLGSGSLWQWKQSKLGTQKQELETIVKTTDLRQQEIDQYSRIIELTSEYINDNEQYSKNPSSDLDLKIQKLKLRLDVMKENFKTLEKNLALLENREPREIPIEFHPAPAMNLTGVAH